MFQAILKASQHMYWDDAVSSVCVTCPWVSSFPGDQWMSDVYNVLSSAALLSSCSLMSVASFGESIHLISALLFSCCLLFFPALFSFPKNTAFLWCNRRTVLLYYKPSSFFNWNFFTLLCKINLFHIIFFKVLFWNYRLVLF